MRASRLAPAFWLAAAIAVTAVGCKSKPKDSGPTCLSTGTSCAKGSDCCSTFCYGTPAATCQDSAGACKNPGDSCNIAGDCCQNVCEGGVCIDTTVVCGPLGQSCTSNDNCCNGHCDTAATHVCYVPPPPPIGTCGKQGASCTANTDCCSQSCDLGAGSPGQCLPGDANTQCVSGGQACVQGEPCCSGFQCSNGICSSGLCTPSGTTNASACSSNSQCCSYNCQSGHCAPVTGGGCFTLYESCTYPTDCCSTNCVGPTGAKRCAPAYKCNAPGDICFGPKDCCTGLCTVAAGSTVPGRCQSATGSGCTEDGVPCSGSSNCCTRQCKDPGTGVTVCGISGGCRMTGDYCDSTAACCGGTDPINPSAVSPYGVYCDLEGTRNYTPYWDPSSKDNHVCSGGQSCNPPGNICGGSDANHVPASQNCCHDGIASGKDVCKPDSNGIMRCFGTCGGTAAGCATGCDGSNPLCCIAPGDVCDFSTECCNHVPCVADQNGVLRCMNVCLPKSTICSTDPAPTPATLGTKNAKNPCCSGLDCDWLGAEIGWACAATTCTKYSGDSCTSSSECCTGQCDATNHCSVGTCKADGNACSTNLDCCSNICDPTNHVCMPPCLAENSTGCTATSDCCTGLTCSIPAGGTSGTCIGGTGPICSQEGQPCATLSDCCDQVNDRCSEGTCQPVPTCPGPSQSCSTTNPCCTTGYDPALMCHATASDGVTPLTCTSTSTACACEQCAAQNEGCSVSLPCCQAAQSYCAVPGTLANCTTSDSNCYCRSIYL